MAFTNQQNLTKSGKFSVGPGALVAAAFIGPGTVTTCIMAGAKYGYALLWAMMISTLATIFIQSYSVKAGIATGKALEKNLLEKTQNRLLKYLLIALILVAIVIGNTAYEAGNITGAFVGLSLMSDAVAPSKTVLLLIIFGLATLILMIEKTRIIIKIMGILVAVMSISFITAAFCTGIDFGRIADSILKPRLPKGDWLMLASIIGTTIVPYNIYLHSAMASSNWKNTNDIPLAIRDATIFILIGGFVSSCIIIASGNFQGMHLSNVSELKASLELVMGTKAGPILGGGLFAAGLSSAVTAPLAASMILQHLFRWEDNMVKIKLARISIVFLGFIISLLGIKPLTIIWIAQIANGILLPISIAALLIIVTDKKFMGDYSLNTKHKISGVILLILSIFLCANTLYTIFIR